MEMLIEKILDIEKQAQRICEEAREDQAHLKEQLDIELHAMHQAFKRRADERIQKLMAYEQGQAEEQVQKIRAQQEEELSVIRRQYEKQKDEWVQRIFRNMIGG